MFIHFYDTYDFKSACQSLIVMHRCCDKCLFIHFHYIATRCCKWMFIQYGLISVYSSSVMYGFTSLMIICYHDTFDFQRECSTPSWYKCVVIIGCLSAILVYRWCLKWILFLYIWCRECFHFWYRYSLVNGYSSTGNIHVVFNKWVLVHCRGAYMLFIKVRDVQN